MLQIALQMLFQLYYTVLNNTIQFKVVFIYGNIIAKPAGPAGQPSQGVPGVPFWPCAYYMLPGNAKC